MAKSAKPSREIPREGKGKGHRRKGNEMRGTERRGEERRCMEREGKAIPIEIARNPPREASRLAASRGGHRRIPRGIPGGGVREN